MRFPVRLAPGERGFVLIVVIWAIGLLALIATSFTLSVRAHLKELATVQAAARAEALADAATNLAILDLVTASERKTFERRYPPDGTRVACATESGDVLLVSIEDEYGKIDINTANEKLLSALLRGLGLETSQADALVDAIVDFRDADNKRRPNGAEAQEYAAAGRSYVPKNAAFDVTEELQQVLGIDAGLFAKMRPFLTVYTGQTGIDPIVASRELLTLLSYSFPMGDVVMSANAGSESASEKPQLKLPPGALVASTRRLYTIRSAAITTGGVVFVREAVVDLGRQGSRPYALRRWRRAALPPGEWDPASVEGGPPPC